MTYSVHDATLGSKLKHLDLSGIALTEARFAPSQVLPWHSHERASLCVLLDGAYTEAFTTGTYQLSRFDLTFKPDGAEHRDRYGTNGARCLIVDLEHSWMRSVREKGPILQTPWFFSSGAFPTAGHRLYT